MKLEELEPERLDYMGVSFGATKQLYKFWRRSDFVPVYMRQTPVGHMETVPPAEALRSADALVWARARLMHANACFLSQNDLTGEHTCIMLHPLAAAQSGSDWLEAYWADFRRRFSNLLSYSFRVRHSGAGCVGDALGLAARVCGRTVFFRAA